MKIAHTLTMVALVCLFALGCEPENAPAPQMPDETASVARAAPPPVENTAPPKVVQLPPGAMPDDSPINLLTSTGDEAEDEVRLAQAKLMGLGHRPVNAEENTAPAPIEPIARVEKVDPVEAASDESPSTALSNYFKGLDMIGLTLSVGKDKKDFAQTALQAATQGDTTLIKDLRDRYKRPQPPRARCRSPSRQGHTTA